MKNIQTLVINNTNTLNNQYNKYRYTFPQPVNFKEGDAIALNSLMIPYSWYNISSQYNNNTISLLIPCSNNVIKTLDITITNGSYDINSLNYYIQQKLIENGYYLYNKTTNKNVFYIENTNLYKIQINLYSIPSSLGSDYSIPISNKGFGSFGLPSTSNNIIRVSFSSLSVGNQIGFISGIYPLTSNNNANTTLLSNKLVNLSPVNSVLINSNVIDNKFNNNSNVFSSFAPFNVDFGSNIVVDNKNLAFISIKPGTYQYIDIQFNDQNGVDLPMNDNNICLILLLSTDNK